ncbi:sulfite exporter TauE/SafE family protein [uncultured Castellaniella sp.]|uniref:sulfite exporter TauE/SafE family protein n=1 Tax=uncultured Castellaniella sp. TaxID=647907 RepID=UPI002636E3AD|nr:sulfite exporter TauE/SafE family protein [uncultured Castellaniella sp.]
MWHGLLQAAPSLHVYLALASITLLGGVMRGFSGYGSGLLMAPVFSLLLAPADVVVIILLLNLLTSLQLMPVFLRRVDWRLTFRLFVPSLAGLPVGLYFLHGVDAMILRRIVAFLVILVAVLMLSGWHYRGRRGVFQDGVVGVSSGFMTAVGGIGGPPVILYLLSDHTLSASVFRAVCLTYFSLGQVATLIPMSAGGIVTGHQLINVVLLLPVAMLANFLGAFLHRWAEGRNQALFRRVSLLFLLATGVFTFLV